MSILREVFGPSKGEIWSQLSQEIGATRENHGQAVALLWQSKQTRTARLRVRSLSQGGSTRTGGFVWGPPYGTA